MKAAPPSGKGDIDAPELTCKMARNREQGGCADRKGREQAGDAARQPGSGEMSRHIHLHYFMEINGSAISWFPVQGSGPRALNDAR